MKNQKTQKKAQQKQKQRKQAKKNVSLFGETGSRIVLFAKRNSTLILVVILCIVLLIFLLINISIRKTPGNNAPAFNSNSNQPSGESG